MDAASETPARLVFEAERGLHELRDCVGDENILAVLTESTANEWYRQWDRPGSSSTQLGLVEYYEVVRGATSASHDTRAVGDDLVLSTAQRPVGATGLLEILTEHLDRWKQQDRGTIIYIESLGSVLTDADRSAIVDAVDRLLDRPDSPGIIAAADPETVGARAVVDLESIFSEIVGWPEPSTSTIAAVTRLQAEDPTTFGYLQRYWREAIRAIEAVDRTYPQAKQLHSAVEGELSPRMLGATLSGLAWLDILSLRGETNGPNRYDCRSYDPDRAARLGFAAESLKES